jgi:hypothetical protein
LANENNWQRSRAALEALGINVEPYDDHEQHRHSDFVQPARVRITAPLNFATTVMPEIADTTQTMPSVFHDFVPDMADRLGPLENGMDIYYPVDLETTNIPYVFVADARQASRERAVGICSVADNGWNDLPGEIARGYLMRYENKTLQELPPLASLKDIRIVKQAKHGNQIFAEEYDGMLLTYHPYKNYIGKDNFQVVVSLGDGSVRIVYYIVIQSESPDQLSDSEYEKLCPKKGWIISRPSPEDYNDPVGIAPPTYAGFFIGSAWKTIWIATGLRPSQ